jgi:electron transfer flavoprotein alpha subunit
MSLTPGPLHIAVLVKQIPAVEEMRLGTDGRLIRHGTDLELSAFCRRAVSKSVELAASVPGSAVTVMTLGPPSAEDGLREAIAWGLDRDVDISGILLTDSVFAGSDTIATARTLAAALRREGSFDLVLTGKNSLDADTGQVPPQLAELLDLPFAAGVRHLALEGDVLRLGCEHDDCWTELETRLPALLSCAERLCDPAKVAPDRRALVPDRLIRALTAADVGLGRWGTAGSLTSVCACREISVDRLRQVTPDAPVATQVKDAVRVLVDRGALVAGEPRPAPATPTTGGSGPLVAVIADPGHDVLTRELCSLAARLASDVRGSTLLLAPNDVTAAEAGSWGADRLVRIEGAEVEEDVARAVASWAASAQPWGILAGSTAYGREIASRVAASIGAGLTGDATDVEVVDDRLVAWKPAFGGQLVAAVTATSPVQMVTVRAGVLPRSMVRERIAEQSAVATAPRGRVHVLARRLEDSLESFAEADVVIGTGRGVEPGDLHQLDELRRLLGAEIGCTRKVTDAGWMPHARQIGVTGRSISPRLYVAIGMSGKFNHMVGVRAAGTILAINPDPHALVWDHADAGLVATYQECLPLLVEEVRQALERAPSRPEAG